MTRTIDYTNQYQYRYVCFRGNTLDLKHWLQNLKEEEFGNRTRATCEVYVRPGRFLLIRGLYESDLFRQHFLPDKQALLLTSTRVPSEDEGGHSTQEFSLLHLKPRRMETARKFTQLSEVMRAAHDTLMSALFPDGTIPAPPPPPCAYCGSTTCANQACRECGGCGLIDSCECDEDECEYDCYECEDTGCEECE